MAPEEKKPKEVAAAKKTKDKNPTKNNSITISFVKRWRMELATAADRQEVAKDPKEEKKEAKDSKAPQTSWKHDPRNVGLAAQKPLRARTSLACSVTCQCRSSAWKVKDSKKDKKEKEKEKEKEKSKDKEKEKTKEKKEDKKEEKDICALCSWITHECITRRAKLKWVLCQARGRT